MEDGRVIPYNSSCYRRGITDVARHTRVPGTPDSIPKGRGSSLFNQYRYDKKILFQIRSSPEHVYHCRLQRRRPGKEGGKSEVKVPENAVDLSAAGTANCYIVKPGGTVVFDAQYKGNSTTESIGNPVTAELVWQDAKI